MRSLPVCVVVGLLAAWRCFGAGLTPSVYLAYTPSAPAYGDPFTIGALVLGLQGGPTPTGTVTVSWSGGSAQIALDNTGHGTVSVPSAGAPPFAAGSYAINGAYSGDANYQSASAKPMNLTIGKVAALVTIASASPQVSQAVTLRATVTPANWAAVPLTGTVDFSAGGNPIAGCTGLRLQNGSAACTTTFQQVGMVNLAVAYTGDANANASSGSIQLAVGKMAASIYLAISPSAPVYGAPLTLDALVLGAQGAPAPTGIVTFFEDGSALAAVAMGNDGRAMLAAPGAQIPAFSVGSHTVSATYNGDANYGVAASAAATFSVGRTSAQIAVSSSLNPASPDQSVTFTASVSGGVGLTTPTGSVQWSDGPSSLGAAALIGGKAVWTGLLSAGLHAITATYLGDATFTSVTSANYWQTVNKLGSATALSVSGNTLIATITRTSPGATVPTGNVSLVDSASNAIIASAQMAAGGAIFARPSSRTVAALYSGDANFLGSESALYVPLAAGSAASYATDAFAPDELVTLFGTSLGAGSVTVTDSAGAARQASIFFASPTQANIVMPSNLASGPATVSFTDSTGFTVSESVTVNPVAPGLFTANGDGKGAPAGQIVRVHSDGSTDAPQDLAVADPTSNQWMPAPIDTSKSGDTIYVILYGSGIRHFGNMPTCAIGGVAAPVTYAGPQGSFPGLDQINLRLPAGLPSGTWTLTVTADGRASNGVMIAIQ
ncbi:MAG TPA: Ig-like domain repeat protein [Bryobacteraceae bacterium]|nr:Ig-like domain repeat protein [Bryobacteraceae bacterium]